MKIFIQIHVQNNSWSRVGVDFYQVYTIHKWRSFSDTYFFSALEDKEFCRYLSDPHHAEGLVNPKVRAKSLLILDTPEHGM
jgi:hypothetical protein